ncbi:hypothetical protein R80B4_01702 [Fibrobacteres bacterium R8-0-B4]
MKAQSKRVRTGRFKALLLAALTAGGLAVGCAKNPDKDPVIDIPGILIDTRDGQAYFTVKIGDQRWMAENLHYKTNYGSFCFDGLYSCSDYYTPYCRESGRLYWWEAAMKACPAGWRLPDTADWRKLEAATGGKEAAKRLKTNSGWWSPLENGNDGNGTDDYDFHARPAASCYLGGYFEIMSSYCHWWTATPAPKRGGMIFDRRAYHIGIREPDSLIIGTSETDELGYSVRCVKDER